MKHEEDTFAAVSLPAARPGPVRDPATSEEAKLRSYDGEASHTTDESNIIARHVFGQHAHPVNGIDYAIEYRLASYAGGDIADVYEFDNESVAFIVADVEGRGVVAATLATLIKYGLRAYASAGMAPDAVMAQIDRLYIEHCAFERTLPLQACSLATSTQSTKSWDIHRQVTTSRYSCARTNRPGCFRSLRPSSASSTLNGQRLRSDTSDCRTEQFWFWRPTA